MPAAADNSYTLFPLHVPKRSPDSPHLLSPASPLPLSVSLFVLSLRSRSVSSIFLLPSHSRIWSMAYEAFVRVGEGSGERVGSKVWWDGCLSTCSPRRRRMKQHYMFHPLSRCPTSDGRALEVRWVLPSFTRSGDSVFLLRSLSPSACNPQPSMLNLREAAAAAAAGCHRHVPFLRH